MARPTMAVVNTAVNALFDAFSALKSLPFARTAAQSVQEVYSYLIRLYTPELTLTVTDVADATLAAAFTGSGEIAVAFAATRYPLEVGRTFSVTGVGDTTDNALAGAKGSAVANTDIFEVTNTGTPAVVYLGQIGDLVFTDNEDQDFGSGQ